MLKKVLSVIISTSMLLGIQTAVVKADELVTPVSKVEVAPGNGMNAIIISSDTSNTFNVYRKDAEGDLTLIDNLSDGLHTDGTSTNIWYNAFGHGEYVFLDNDLTNSTKYTYVVKAKNSEGVESTGVEASGTPEASKGTWQVYMNNSFVGYQNNNYAYSFADIRNNVGVDNSAGLYIKKMGLDDSNGSFMDIFVRPGVALDSTKTYKIKWQQKLGSKNSFIIWGNWGYGVRAGSTSADGTTFGEQVNIYNDASEQDTWAEKFVYINNKADANFEFRIHRYCEHMIFDNIEIYEVDESLAEVGANLIADKGGDFELKAPQNVEIIPNDGFNVISVTATTGLFNIYRKDTEGKLTLITDLADGTLADGVTTNFWSNNGFTDYVFVDKGLTNDTKYTYVVKAKDINGLESAGVEASGTPCTGAGSYQWKQVTAAVGYQNNVYAYGKAEVKNGAGVDGSAGLHIVKLCANDDAGSYLDVGFTSGVTLDDTKTYKVTWKEKTSANNCFTIWDHWGYTVNSTALSADGVNYNSTLLVGHEPVDNNTWVERSSYFKGTVANMTFRVHRYCNPMDIDDIEFYELDENLEVVSGNILEGKGGDFELQDPELVEVVPNNGFNVIAVTSTTSNKFNIYRRNTDESLTLLKVKEAPFTADPTVTNVWNNVGLPEFVFLDEGLTNDIKYTYVVKAVTEDGLESPGVECSGTPEIGAGSYQWKQVTSKIGYQSNVYAYGMADVRNNIGVDGSAALYIKKLGLSSDNGSYMDVGFATGVAIDNTKTYKLTWEEKTSSNNAFTLWDHWGYALHFAGKVSLDGGENYGENPVLGHEVSDNNKFVTRTAYLQNGSLADITFRIHRFADPLIIDNIELYEVNSDLETVGDNLLKNADGNFEEGFKKSVSATIKYYAAFGADAGDDYGQPMDKISALADLADYETDTLYAEATIKNVGFTEGKSVKIILAVYKDGNLYDLKSISATVPETTGETYGIAYTVPALTDGDYSVQLLVWDGLTTMVPYAVSTELTEN